MNCSSILVRELGMYPTTATINCTALGSSHIWVNKTVYQEALKKNKVSWATSDSGRLFECEYVDGTIKGDLYKDTISFQDKSIFVNQHIFGTVDENTCPTAKTWREDKRINIKGVLGIGPRALNKSGLRVRDVNGNVIQNECLPSLVDNMKDQNKISTKTIGLYFHLPNSSSVTMEGELHVGGSNKNVYIEGSMREIPGTLRSSSKNFHGLDLTLKYNGKILMDGKPGIIDSGTSLIGLPGSVLDAYVEEVGKHKDGNPIVIYDDEKGLYRIAKKDVDKLKDLEFDFVKGKDAKFKLSPAAQISSPGLQRRNSNFLSLVFDKLPHNEGHQFVLGLGWSKSASNAF